MSRQIIVKSLDKETSIFDMYKEALSYLKEIGFKEIPLLSATDFNLTLRCHFLAQDGEKIILEYKRDENEEHLRISFEPLEIRFVYDILLMRFNQMIDQNSKIFIYNY